ncbi:MAG: tetratricopeptide repeat protein [Pseudomonadota bacterium]
MATNKCVEARELLEAHLTQAPDDMDAWLLLAVALQRSNMNDAALGCYTRLIAHQPDHRDAHYNLALLYAGQGNYFAAQPHHDHAVVSAPGNPWSYINRGINRVALCDPAAALHDFDEALRLNPRLVEAMVNRAHVLRALGRHLEASSEYKRALQLQPDNSEILFQLGAVAMQLEKFDEALAHYTCVLAISPMDVAALHNKAVALEKIGLYLQQVATLQTLLCQAPHYPFALGKLLFAKLRNCDWEGLEHLIGDIERAIEAGEPAVEPFIYQLVATSESLVQRCAEIHTATLFPQKIPSSNPVSCVPPLQPIGRKIRVGYVSSDFRQQALAVLAVGLFEAHDKTKFDIILFDRGGHEPSDLRVRILAASTEVADISKLTHDQACAQIRAAAVDILVDFNGFIGVSNQPLFSTRPCPIQVNYLRSPGTLGASYMDYIVADATVIPPGHEKYYTEKVVRLPGTYQVNDAACKIFPTNVGRAELGFPEHGFVFACFNNGFKISPAIFALWMRLLQRLPDAVLWLIEDDPIARQNLESAASRLGINHERLVFTRRVPLQEHFARQRLADLFLDTLQYNAHATASAALWSGLPVLTCMGHTFAARVGASLLRAIGLPELITHSLSDYEELAFALASDPARLTYLRQRLDANRLIWPLFDTPRVTRHLETAYCFMYERSREGLPPEHYSVVDTGSCVP